MKTTELKYFSPKEARKTLPLVKKIVKDILDYSFQIKKIADSLGGITEGNAEISKMISQIDYFLDELEEIGCFYKDWNFDIGLVDFPAFINGREVYLCWRSDEEEILYYHGVEEGYAGRKLIPIEYSV